MMNNFNDKLYENKTKIRDSRRKIDGANADIIFNELSMGIFCAYGALCIAYPELDDMVMEKMFGGNINSSAVSLGLIMFTTGLGILNIMESVALKKRESKKILALQMENDKLVDSQFSDILETSNYEIKSKTKKYV